MIFVKKARPRRFVAINQAPRRNLLVPLKLHQMGAVVPINQAPRCNLMLIKEMRENIRMFQMLGRPAKLFGLQGFMADFEGPIIQAPSGSQYKITIYGRTMKSR
jgi:hypothetical protein